MDQENGQWRPLWVLLSIIGCSYIANFGGINKNDFKIFKIFKDQGRTSVPYFSSKNRTLLIYMIFWFAFELISLKNDALKFFIFVIPSISFSKYRINSFQNKHWNVAKYTNQSCKIVTDLVNRHQTAWLFPEISFNHFHCPTKKTVSDIPLIWDADVLKNRQRNRKPFSLACFLFQGCLLFKSSFEMRFLSVATRYFCRVLIFVSS